MYIYIYMYIHIIQGSRAGSLLGHSLDLIDLRDLHNLLVHHLGLRPVSLLITMIPTSTKMP